MSHKSSPQAREMADESMVRNLAAQIEAIWPQERPIFERHPGTRQIIDVGCGTGEIEPRLAEVFPQARIVGVDLDEAHLERARARCAAFKERVRFEQGDALHLHHGDAEFDLAVCRHVVQAVPDARRVVEEMVRVLKPGGRLHVLAEDYGMMWCTPTEHDADGFWQRIPQLYGKAIGCDLHVGRHMFTYMKDLGLKDIRVDYVVVDTMRVERDTFARIWEAWRDGYTDTLVQTTGVPREELELRWREMIAAVRDPRGYALWQVPIWTAAK